MVGSEEREERRSWPCSCSGGWWGRSRFPVARWIVVSVTKEKAGELKRQMEEIATASGLDPGCGSSARRRPGRVDVGHGYARYPERRIGGAGHASGFDECVDRRAWLLSERNRDLVNGMRSATSARDGRFMALSIMGDAPIHAGDLSNANTIRPWRFTCTSRTPDCELDDVAAWHAANPGLAAGSSRLSYMQDEARRVLASAGRSSELPGARSEPSHRPRPGTMIVLARRTGKPVSRTILPARDGECRDRIRPGRLGEHDRARGGMAPVGAARMSGARSRRPRTCARTGRGGWGRGVVCPTWSNTGRGGAVRRAV